jgi:hypothetical protein
MAAEAPHQLRLLAEDAEDLQVISAALQDAVVKVGDICWEPKSRRLTLELNRFRWEAAGHPERIRSSAKEAVLELLALRFEPGDEPPGGRVVFEFAQGGDLRADVECLEAVLADVSRAWPAKREPNHDDARARGA